MNTGYIPPKRPPVAEDLSPITAPELLQAAARHMAARPPRLDPLMAALMGAQA